MAADRPSVVGRIVPMAVCLVIGAGLGVSLTMMVYRQDIILAQPQLDVKNTGSAPMLVRLGDTGSVVVQPGGEAGFRVAPGQVLTVFSGKDESAKSKAFHLGAGASPVRIRAEINADNPEKIEASYVFASDWTK
jgi:hypothetical protein